ncbi:MAG: uroporphyrinogen decarboxylase [Acidobacteria bacterium]|jgi:uroporphyrinogen decarboxylase|nr:uroporphyrinogen decarboxylase [Acidobacteriota bacterium]
MNDRFLRACRREPVDRTPVWFMRQAGRYMAEYQALRKRHTLLELCRTPELAVEVTLQPIKALGFDAAILFSDLLIPLAPLGLPFDFQSGEGPVVEKPIRSRADVEALRRFEPREELGMVLEAIRLLRRELKVPLIGFAGAPFTLATYAIEGGSSKNLALTKGLMYGEPDTWHQLAGLLADVVSDYLRAQVEAGAQAVQLFDSWIGALDEADYREFVLPHVARIFEGLDGLDVPQIHFGTATGHLLGLQREAGGTVVGVDWRTPLDEGWERAGLDVAIQGNLDPTLLFAPRERLLARVDDVLRRAGGRPGHIFNLGHGILPGTPVENVKAVVDHVHEATAR